MFVCVCFIFDRVTFEKLFILAYCVFVVLSLPDGGTAAAAVAACNTIQPADD